jgi:hypothetical protein
MDKFLDAFDQPKLNQQNINHLNRSVTSNEIGAAIKCLLTKKGPGTDGFTAEFYKTFNENLIPITPQTFLWNRKGRNTSKLILCSQYYTHSKTRTLQKQRILTNMFNEHRCKISL